MAYEKHVFFNLPETNFEAVEGAGGCVQLDPAIVRRLEAQQDSIQRDRFAANKAQRQCLAERKPEMFDTYFERERAKL